MITNNIKVLRYTNKKDFDGYQLLIKSFFLFGIKIWTTILDREEVPSWANIQIATLGSTDWKSKFKEYII